MNGSILSPHPIEDSLGAIVGIEVKAAATVLPAALKGMRFLRELAGSRFRRDVLLTTGRVSQPVDRDVWAMPVSALWTLGAAELSALPSTLAQRSASPRRLNLWREPASKLKPSPSRRVAGLRFRTFRR
jgi:hypothetical protein